MLSEDIGSEAKIRKLRAQDCGAVGEFSRAATKMMNKRYLSGVYPTEAAEFDIWNNSSKRIAQAMKDPDFFGFAAVEGDEICGILLGFVYGKSGLAKISWIAVAPKHQHEGIGIRLMTAAEEYLKEKGCHKIFLNTLPALIPAVRLYMKFGMMPEAYLRKHWWGVDFLVMGKWIGEYRKR